jgi:hypothetical protein
VREKYFFFVQGRLEQPSQNKNLLYRHEKPNEPTKEGFFYMYSLSPHLSQLQQSAGATPFYCSLSVYNTPERDYNSRSPRLFAVVMLAQQKLRFTCYTKGRKAKKKVK